MSFHLPDTRFLERAIMPQQRPLGIKPLSHVSAGKRFAGNFAQNIKGCWQCKEVI
jgi:hypothetical protein